LSFGPSFDTKQRVKEATDIVELVGGYLQLRREGRGYKALCPWHDDSRPSLQVNQERQSWKCWVCNLGGDVFSFVMQMENVAFPEALAMLADRAGIALKPAANSGRPASPADDKRLLFKAMAWAEQQFHDFLLGDPAADVARRYLAERQISGESIQRFHLGFAPAEWDWLLKRAGGTPFIPPVLEKVGLVAKRPNGPGNYDRFRGRVLFPIFDLQGRPVGMGGRVLPELNPGDVAKYINSPETPLFSKSKLLYGLHAARDAIKKTGVALVMEGYTDCIAAHQAGFTNAVAVLGTALGSQQIRTLSTCAPIDRDLRIVLVLDGDDAGRKRANEVLELFLAANADLRVLTLPGEADPCEFLQEQGAEEFARLIDAAPDALRHAVATATANVDLGRDVHGARRALDKLVETIAKAPSPADREDHVRDQIFLSRLAADFHVPEEELRHRMAELRAKGKRQITQAPIKTGDSPPAASTGMRAADLDAAERELLEILLHYPQSIAILAEQLSVQWLASPVCRRIVERCLDGHHCGLTIDFARLLLEIDDQEVKNLLVELDESGRSKGAVEFDARLHDVLEKFRHREHQQLTRTQTAALKEGRLAEEDELALLKQIEQQVKTRQGISAPMEG
jgi:DNA primase